MPMHLRISNNRIKTVLPYFLFLLVGVISLAPICRGYFFYNELDFLDGALRVLRDFFHGTGSLWAPIRADFVQHLNGDPHGHYRPGIYVITTLLVWLMGSRYLPFSILSITVHILSAMILFVLAQHFFKDRIKAFAAAMLFLCQNWGINAILWIGAALGYGFSALFFLCVLLLYVKYSETKKIIYLLFSALCLYFQLTFSEEARLTILIIFLFYLLVQGVTKEKRWWLFIFQPIFYPYYIVLVIWSIQVSTQNLMAVTGTELATFTNHLSFAAITMYYSSFHDLISHFILQISGWQINSLPNQIVYWFGVTFLLGCISLVLLLFSKKPQYLFRFLVLWLLVELLPRFLFALLGSRGLYSIYIPLALMFVVMIFWLAERVTLRRQGWFSASQLAGIMVLCLIVFQMVHVQFRIKDWNYTTSEIVRVQRQLLGQMGEVSSADHLVFMAPTPEQDKMVDKWFFTEQLRVALNRYDLDLTFLAYDSLKAGKLSTQPNTKLLIGTPGAYYRYSPDLSVKSLIPSDLTRQYEQFLHSKQRSQKQRSIYNENSSKIR